MKKKPKSESYRIAETILNNAVLDGTALGDALDMARAVRLENSVDVDGETIYDKDSFAASMELSKLIRTACARVIRETGDVNVISVYRRAMLFDAPYDFDCYCRFLEWDREPRKRFYEPRRKQLKTVVDALQDLSDRKINLLAISMPPGTGKSTLAFFFITWISGKHPELTTLCGSHNSGILRGMYDEMLRIMDKEGEYNYKEVFPNAPVVNTNSKDLMIDLESAKRFSTIQFTSVGAGNAGKYRASQLLYCDDLIEGLETAMSADRLDKLWQQYTVDLRQRGTGNFQELHIATRWSVRDIIGRLQTQYEDDPRARFIAFPALNEHDESNFDYPYSLGFTTEFYRKQRDITDDVSWRCVFMNEPIEREGTLYHPSELRRFFTLPAEDPDEIIAVCDTKDQGPDYCVLPVAYRYGADLYIDAILCDNGKPEIVEERIVTVLCKRNVRRCQFESNRGAGRVAETIQAKVTERGGFTSITTKWTQTNKESRIIADSPYAKEHFLFKDESLYDKEYRTAMSQLCGWTMSGKNKHDDVPDAISMLVEFVSTSMNTATVMQRIF